ncbi:putative enterotoxin [Ophiocordyceps australis]|uniref:Putative enterotoxin n=1 Tax=Ophiocordyceps australis TaxID=1399860 RepID=A0A2C5ZL06_9HYPO|nr:putative enterotoxin [Ophiocordyceps australis]
MKPRQLFVLFMGITYAIHPRTLRINKSEAEEAETNTIGVDENDKLNIMLNKRSHPGPSGRSSIDFRAAKMAPSSSKQGEFFRGDSRSPTGVFSKGFSPKGSDMDLKKHLSFAGNSGYVSLTRSKSTAETYAFGRTGEKKSVGYVYKVAPSESARGFWVPGMYKGPEVSRNQEFAVAGKVPAQNIQGAYSVDSKNPKSPKQWVPNKNFAQSSALPKPWEKLVSDIARVNFGSKAKKGDPGHRN